MPILFVAPFVIAAAATAGVVGVPAATIALAENHADDAVHTILLVLALASLSGECLDASSTAGACD
jgi:hypothetical protein